MSRLRYLVPLLCALAVAASCQGSGKAGCSCEPPPPAPQGLADCARYLLRNFEADDAVFGAGVQGCLNWVIENDALADDDPDKLLDCADDVTLQECARSLNLSEDGEPIPGEELTSDDLAGLDLDVLDPPRDPTLASGVVTLKTIECGWRVNELNLARPDQAEVFDTWESYTRHYQPDESAYDEYLARSQEADVEDFPSEFLYTVNDANAVSNALFDLDAYDLYLDLRHGAWDVSMEDDPSTADVIEGETEPVFAFAIRSYAKGLVLDQEQGEGFRQQYSVELDVERPGDLTTRIFVTWAEPRVDGVEPNDPIVFSLAGRESRASMLALADLCDEG